jgi:asparagine synthase (glutamine-hydrolysing)
MNEKFLLKELMKNELPQTILNRHKQAYRAPVLEAFTGSKTPDYINDMLSVSSLKECEVFDPISVINLTNKIKITKISSEVDNMAFVGILSTQLLYSLFVKDFRKLHDQEILKGKIRNKNIPLFEISI